MRNFVVEIADAYGVTAEEILGDDRTRNLVAARQELMLVLSEETELSMLEIGGLINRHRTTVIQGIKSARRRRERRTRQIGAAVEWFIANAPDGLAIIVKKRMGEVDISIVNEDRLENGDWTINVPAHKAEERVRKLLEDVTK